MNPLNHKAYNINKLYLTGDKCFRSTFKNTMLEGFALSSYPLVLRKNSFLLHEAWIYILKKMKVKMLSQQHLPLNSQESNMIYRYNI